MTAVSHRSAVRAPRHPPDRRNVELQLWLRLLACSNLISAQLRRMLRRDFDISLPNFDILAQIARPPLNPTMSELSKRLMVSKGSVTDLIERLAEQGLVARQGDAHDARVQRVQLTAKGKRLLDQILPVHDDCIRGLMAGFSAATIAQLSAQLGALKNTLQNPDAPPRPSAARPRSFVDAKSGHRAVTALSKARRVRP